MTPARGLPASDVPATIAPAAGRPAGRRGAAAVGAALVGLTLASPTAAALAGAPARPPVELVVEARARIGRIRPIWDEVNLWKLHSLFGVQHATTLPPGWLREAVPWARYGRVVAALGGNYAPAIAPWCDRAAAAPEHPDTGLGDCGREGVPGAAARNELAREVGGRTVIDYAPFRTALERLLAAGLLPHLNLSAAPAAFTGGVTDFSHYHWNAAPVSDLAGWLGFVSGALAAVRDLKPAGWRVSIVNEPNCLTLVGWEQEIRHVGYAGTPEDYGRTFAATAAAIRDAAPGIRIHAGNYVTSDTFPGEDNLAVYLGALRDALADRGAVGWSDLAAVSVSLYETRDTTVYDFLPVRLARARRAIRAAGLPPLPVKIDELGIHPMLADAFAEATGEPLDTTLWAASWHAEALRAFVAAGDVVSVAPWFGRLFGWNGRGWTPYPKARTYELLGLLAGQLSVAGDDREAGVERTGRRGGLPRLAVSGELGCAPGARCARPKHASSIFALAARAPGGVRVLVGHHQNRPVRDAARLRKGRGRAVRLVVRGLAPGAYTVRHLSIGGPGGAVWDGAATTPLRWRDDGCRRARGGTIEVAAARRMDANTVWLFEAVRRPHCPPRPGAAPESEAAPVRRAPGPPPTEGSRGREAAPAPPR